VTSRDRKERELETLGRLLRAERLQEPPDGVLRRALALGSQLEPRKGLLERLVELVFDSAAQPLPAGVRGAATAERRLLYRIGGEGLETAELDLRLRREAGGTVELTGQLLPPRPGREIEVRAGRRSRKLAAGEAGEFLARNLPGGAELELVFGDPPGPPLVIRNVPLPPDDGDAGAH
jgi:hypothetical protein